MPRCKCCGEWIAPWWMELVIIVVALAIFAAMLASCSTLSVVTPSGVNATVNAFLYCPARTTLRVSEENRTIEVTTDESGVGDVVRSIGANAVEVMRP